MSNSTLMDYEYEDEEHNWSQLSSALFGCFVTIAILINLIGNTLTVLSYASDKKIQKSRQNLYVLNLAITDIAIGTVSMPFYALYILHDFTWIFGHAFCKVWLVIDFWVCAESSLTIILISYDRLLMVRDGIRYNQRQTKRRATIKIAVTWMLSFILYVPAIIGYDLWRGYSTVESGDCDVEFASVVWYTLLTAIIEFIVPFSLLSIFSIMLYYNIVQRTKSLSVVQDSETPHQERLLRKDKKAARSLFILITVYALCWIPYTISTVILSLCEDCINYDVYDGFTWLLWMNSSINPFLYAFTNSRFREHFRRRILCCTCKGYVTSVQPMTIQENTVFKTNTT